MAYQGLGIELENVMPMAIATGLFSSVCSIQMPDGVLVDAGQPSGNYITLGGMANIPCMAPPASFAKITAEETKSIEDVQSFAPLHVLLSGWYPILADGVSMGWQAVIDGVKLDILGAESDSQKQMTRLLVRRSGL
jgi:hypothetical protein